LQLADRTVKDHKFRIGRILDYLQKDCQKISKEDLRSYLLAFKHDHAPATYAGVLKSLRVFFRDFLDCSELVNSFKFPQIPFKPKIVPSKSEIQRFFDAINSEIGEALFLFYASNGLHKSEVLRLTKDSIDFEKRMIVPSAHFGVTKSSYVSFYNLETEQALNKIELGEDRLFNLSDRKYKKIWKNAKKKSGVHITAQKLREWFCCEMGNLGVSDRYIDAFCGRTPNRC
jgi:integrase